MFEAKLSSIAAALDAQLVGNDLTCKGINIDSRTIKQNELFVAIRGEQFDGHNFAEQAAKNGACAIITEKKLSVQIPQIIVNNTRLSLGKLAKWWRDQFNIPVIAFTGSCGKTTTKAMLESILTQKLSVLAPEKTFNNDIGMPLTLLRLGKQHQVAALEMGTNHFGEIKYLTEIARPDIAAIINIGLAHIGELGNRVEGIVEAKSEIFLGLPTKGIAVLNRDDQYFEVLKSKVTDKKIITFGTHPQADVRAEKTTLDHLSQPTFNLMIGNQHIEISLKILGEHNVSNALAACAMAYALQKDIDIKTMKQGLESMTAVAKRLVRYPGIHQAKVIDDTYNANPTAVIEALKVLANEKGKKIFVFGDMGELGEHSKEQHQKIGQLARQLHIDHVFATGLDSKLTIDAFGTDKGIFFNSKRELIAELKKMMAPKMTVLVKGSRSQKMEEVVQHIIEKG